MVDPARVRSTLLLRREYRAELARLAELPRQQFAEEPAYGYALERLVQLAGKPCIDLATHIVSSRGWGVPREFREAFAILANHQVLNAELAPHLRQLTGLRNRLVHAYDGVNDRRLLDSLSEGLADLDAFAKVIADLLDDDAGRAS